MKTVGITGYGFIGGYVAKELLLRDYKVIVMDRTDKRQQLPDGVEFFLGDVRDEVAMTEFAAHVDGIIHLAAVLGTQETIQNPRPAAKSNLIGGLNFLESVAQYDIPGVYIAVGNWWMNNPYSITKNMIERFTHMYNKDRGTRVNIVRAVNAYGPRQSIAAPFGDSKVRKITPALVCRALSGVPMELYGGGKQISDMVYVVDVAKALVTALEYADNGKVIDHAIEIGPVESNTILEVAELVNEVIQKKGYKPVAIQPLPMRPGETEGTKVSADTNTLKDIDFCIDCLVPLEEGLESTIDWFIENKGTLWNEPAK